MPLPRACGFAYTAVSLQEGKMPQPQPGRDLDATRVDPQHYRTETENEHVRVIRVHYGARERSVMHAHPACVAVFLNDCRVRMTYPDGRSEEREMRAGQTYYSGPEEHLPENLSDAAIEVILIELKR
jgi:quercetin dioxygenase-like cupin family protein